jgi:hypothetical protein
MNILQFVISSIFGRRQLDQDDNASRQAIPISDGLLGLSVGALLGALLVTIVLVSRSKGRCPLCGGEAVRRCKNCDSESKT